MHKDGVSQESQPHSSTEVLSNKTRRPSASTYSLICPDPIPSGGSSTSEAGSQIPLSEPSASSTDDSATQTKSDRAEQQMRFAAPGAPPRKDVVDIPGNRGGKKVYFTVAVQTPDCDAEVWKQKFSYFYKLLNDAINSSQDLRDQLRPGRELSFEMHMVGKTLETARPSVVVFCFYKHFEELRKLFRKRLQDQMNCEKRFSDYLNLSRRGQEPNNKVDLVYFCLNKCPIEQKASEDTLASYSEAAATWCGGLVKSGSSTSTLGLAVYAPDFLGVLTVDHVFHPPVTPNCTWSSQAEEDLAGVSNTLGSHSDSSEQENKHELWLEDTDEYDFDDTTWQSETAIAENTKASATDTVSVNSYHNTNGDVVMTKWQRVLPEAPLDDKSSYLDWALVRPMLDVGAHCLPNIFYPDGLDGMPVKVGGVFKGSPAHWARVFMVSGLRGVLKGHILASCSVFGPTPSYEACETWTVILDSDSVTADILLEGECGSIIIDHESREIYGHVVACGPLGQVYVSPMKYVLGQIKMCFEIKEAQLTQQHKNVPVNDSLAERAIMDKLKVRGQIVEALKEAKHPKTPITTLVDFLNFVKDYHLPPALYRQYEGMVVEMWFQKQQDSYPRNSDGSPTRDNLKSRDNDNQEDHFGDLPSLEEEAEIGTVWIVSPSSAQFHPATYKPYNKPGSYIQDGLMQESGLQAREDGAVVIQWYASGLRSMDDFNDNAATHTACRVVNQEQAKSMGMNVDLVLGTDCTKELEHQVFGEHVVRRASRRLADIIEEEDPQIPMSPAGSPSLEQPHKFAQLGTSVQPVVYNFHGTTIFYGNSDVATALSQIPGMESQLEAMQHGANTVPGNSSFGPSMTEMDVPQTSGGFRDKRKMDDEHESRPKNRI
ncbi:hypothetical protein G7054_g1738 [Neopestalotiopsis clavispora]|nr:hypothetical protein G7054_g1738 [Neopestalotiopsis clavispora]